MRLLPIFIVSVLCLSVLPITIAESGGKHNFSGSVLTRSAVSNTVLIDQNGENYPLHSEMADATVVSFIFTRCHDVCPTITQNLKTTQNQLSDEDVAFISISVDPDYDTPERLKEYTELHGVDWPHLTSDNVTLEGVWDEFLVRVDKAYIESHDDTDDDSGDHSHHHGHDETDHDEMDHDEMDHPETVTVVMPDGNSTEYNVTPTGWDLLTIAAHQNNWTINSSLSSWGHMVSGINGEESPSDSSWWWELHTWNLTTSSWEASMVGIDGVEPEYLAFAPNSTNDSLIPIPDLENSSFTIVQSDGTNDTSELGQVSAWHQTLAALDNFEAPDSAYGHYMNSIDNVSAPLDWSWWWQLHYWNETTENWSESQLGMDSLYEQMHIAWAPNSTSDSMIPAPVNMIDDSQPVNDTVEELDYETMHTTLTFILNEDWEPKVSWSGYNWDVDDFADDVKMVIDDNSKAEDSDSIPGFTFVLASSAIGLAIIASRREE
tara:strand:+ start:5127 stop:6596 length:1470 start_codon:yes stop_codon:yes gene_type:complete